MVAETEDLVIEYCMTTEKITNLCAKVGEEESLYGRMRKRHLRDWPDDTLRIKDDGHSKSISEFRKQLLGLKHYTASLKNPRFNMQPESKQVFDSARTWMQTIEDVFENLLLFFCSMSYCSIV